MSEDKLLRKITKLVGREENKIDKVDNKFGAYTGAYAVAKVLKLTIDNDALSSAEKLERIDNFCTGLVDNYTERYPVKGGESS